MGILIALLLILSSLCCMMERQQKQERDLQVLEPMEEQIWVVRATPVVKAASIAIQEDLATAVEHPEAKVEMVSRGEGRPVIMECTAYTLREEECGKAPGDPWYGITASGAHVEPWHTIAASRSIPFGTRIYIPYFADKPNGGIFTVQDRGGAITDGHLDIYMESYEDAIQFGRRHLEVYILGEG